MRVFFVFFHSGQGFTSCCVRSASCDLGTNKKVDMYIACRLDLGTVGNAFFRADFLDDLSFCVCFLSGPSLLSVLYKLDYSRGALFSMCA